MILRGHPVLVTGGISDIGAAIADAFHRLGKKVYVCASNFERLAAFSQTIPGIQTIECDIQHDTDVEQIRTQIEGNISVLANSAGILQNLSFPQNANLVPKWVEIDLNRGGRVGMIDAFLPDLVQKRGAKTAQALLNHLPNETVLHGDLHHENVLRSSSRCWLAIDAKGLRGETIYDGAMAVFNPQGHDTLVLAPDRIAATTDTLANALNVSQRRLLQFTFAHACLCACCSMETSTFSSDRALSVARIIERMLAA